MRTRSIVLASSAACLAALTLGAGPALAAAAPHSVGHAQKPEVLSCTAGDTFAPSGYNGLDLHDLGPLLEDYNNTGKTEPEVMTATVGGSMTVTVSASGSFDLDAIVTGFKATFGVSGSVSLTGTEGTNTTISTPNHYYALAQFGIWYYNTNGTYGYVDSACKEVDEQSITASVPHSVGFKSWTSKTG